MRLPPVHAPACGAQAAAPWGKLAGRDVGPVSGYRASLHRKQGLTNAADHGKAPFFKFLCVTEYTVPAHTWRES